MTTSLHNVFLPSPCVPMLEKRSRVFPELRYGSESSQSYEGGPHSATPRIDSKSLPKRTPRPTQKLCNCPCGCSDSKSTSRVQHIRNEHPSERRQARDRGVLNHSEVEDVVENACGSDILTALKDTQAQCRATLPEVQVGGSLWYYVSLMFFSKKPTDQKEVRDTELTCGGQDVATSQLLTDLGHSSLPDLYENYMTELNHIQTTIDTLMQESHFNQEIHHSEDTLLVTSDSTRTDYLQCQKYRENDQSRILDLLKCRSFREQNNSYLIYSEHRRALKHVDDSSCAVCGGGDSVPPDDWIVICSGCELAVHMRCYGIPSLPDVDWFCDVCLTFGKHNRPPCGLCQHYGGALKQTIHEKDWPNSDAQQCAPKQFKLWTHLYCAQVHSAFFLIPESKDLIDLSDLPATAWQRQCSFCSETGGACVTCSFPGCAISFHAECWKRTLHPSAPWNKYQHYCKRHSANLSFESVKYSESLQLQEVAIFVQLLSQFRVDRIRGQRGRRKRSGSFLEEFTEKESADLLQRLKHFLRTINAQRNSGFLVTVEKNTGGVTISMPETFNIVAPELVQSQGLTILGKSREQCYWHYAAMYPSLLHNLRKPKVELTSSALEQLSDQPIVTKKRRLVQHRPMPSRCDTLIRLPWTLIKEAEAGTEQSTFSTQEQSDEDVEERAGAAL